MRSRFSSIFLALRVWVLVWRWSYSITSSRLSIFLSFSFNLNYRSSTASSWVTLSSALSSYNLPFVIVNPWFFYFSTSIYSYKSSIVYLAWVFSDYKPSNFFSYSSTYFWSRVINGGDEAREGSYGWLIYYEVGLCGLFSTASFGPRMFWFSRLHEVTLLPIFIYF